MPICQKCGKPFEWLVVKGKFKVPEHGCDPSNKKGVSKKVRFNPLIGVRLNNKMIEDGVMKCYIDRVKTDNIKM